MQVKTTPIQAEGYPKMLRQIFDAPGILSHVGSLEALKRPCVAIVGTRRCSTYGEGLAFEFARALSEQGICVVSGLAYGIDAAAHRGALQGGGVTAAVLAQALPEIMPARHRGLAEEILAAGGVLLSEKGAAPFRRTDYLVRNRLISGLCLGVLVVEAGERSGALNTANHAVEQNRHVMALPGRLGDAASVGCLDLIRRGAELVRSPQEVLAALDLQWRPPLTQKLSPAFEAVYLALQQEPMSAEELGERFGQELNDLYSTLGELELRGLIQRTQSRRFVVTGEGYP